MKICCLTLGLLLLISVSDAMPRALRFETNPGNCCFSFHEKPFPSNRVASITKTHKLCRKQGFIIQTVKGRQICCSLSPWAEDMYNTFHGDKGSGQQN